MYKVKSSLNLSSDHKITDNFLYIALSQLHNIAANQYKFWRQLEWWRGAWRRGVPDV